MATAATFAEVLARGDYTSARARTESELTMTPTDFLHLLEDVLRQRRLPFSRGAAIAFVESCWELIDDNPDAWYWSERICETNGAVNAAVAEER